MQSAKSRQCVRYTENRPILNYQIGNRVVRRVDEEGGGGRGRFAEVGGPDRQVRVVDDAGGIGVGATPLVASALGALAIIAAGRVLGCRRGKDRHALASGSYDGANTTPTGASAPPLIVRPRRRAIGLRTSSWSVNLHPSRLGSISGVF
jgi:hypothetical protein